MPSRFPRSLILCLAVLLAAGVCAGLLGCSGTEEFQVRGTTMGTAYRVIAPRVPARARAGLETDIARRLEEIMAQFSIFREDSEISRFNALDGDPPLVFPVSPEFEAVIRVSMEVHALTGGAFDPTLKPLSDLWGFGPAARRMESRQPPAARDVEEALARVGLDRVDVPSPGQVRKLDPRVQLDFGAVAKGYGVDQVAAVLARRGITDFLVDIGGDILASGSNAHGLPWRVGVNRPVAEAAWDDVFMVLQVTERAVATSGDYRNFRVVQGRRLGHILDPRSGMPVQNNVAGVTVVAASAVFADALATGLTVLGADDGLALVEGLPGVEAIFVLRDEAGQNTTRMSSGFAALVDPEWARQESGVRIQ